MEDENENNSQKLENLHESKNPSIENPQKNFELQ